VPQTGLRGYRRPKSGSLSLTAQRATKKRSIRLPRLGANFDGAQEGIRSVLTTAVAAASRPLLSRQLLNMSIQANIGAEQISGEAYASLKELSCINPRYGSGPSRGCTVGLLLY